MSLILDALKRAERERKLGQAPAALEEVVVPPPATRQRPGRRPIILGVVAVAIVALAVFAFLRSRHPAEQAAMPVESGFVEVTHDPAPAEAVSTNATDESQNARIEDGASIASLDDLTDGDAPEAAAAPTADEASGGMQVDDGSTLVTPSQPREPAPASAAKSAPAPPSPTTLKLDPRPSSAGTASQPQQLATNANATPINTTPGAGEAVVIPIEEYVPVTATAAAPASSPATAAMPAVRAPAPAPVLTQPDSSTSARRLKDMAPAYRAEFPPIAIDVHVYNDNPQRRFVLINGRRYREGDVLSEGPRITQIVPEGIVFDWRNEQVLYSSR